MEEKLLLDLLLWLALALIHIRILVGAKLKSITIMLGGGILTSASNEGYPKVRNHYYRFHI